MSTETHSLVTAPGASAYPTDATPTYSPPTFSATSSPSPPSTESLPPSLIPLPQSTTPSSSAYPPPPLTNPSSSPFPLPTSPSNTAFPKSAMAAIVAIPTAIVIACIVISVLKVFCIKKKRRRRLELIPEQNNGHSPNPPTDDYNGGRPPEPEDHAVKILPPSSSPPRSPAFTSVDNSSSASSGSKQTLPPPSPGINLGISRTFTYEDLEAATNGFSQTNLLGQGGFGYVYKGILPGSKTIAVKQLKVGGGQGEREFQAEVEIISRVHHRHLVSLVGYCIAGSQRLLVYEFVPNDTLEHHLHGKSQPSMEWSTRLKVATGASRGLAYLHEDCYPKIIHRDIKTSNILLDSNFEAKVADFGLAKLAQDGFTHVSTRVMGTFGYLAPEYASSGKLTDKSDVFSFGVMLLELITGRRPVDTTTSSSEDGLVDWARPLLARAMEDGNLDAVVDPRLQNNYNVDEMIRVVACAASCVRHSARRRPRMGQIVRVLEGVVSIDDLYEGVTPGKSSRYSSVGSPDYDNSQYSEDRRKFRKMALGSQ